VFRQQRRVVVTTTVKVTSHNAPARVLTRDMGRQVEPARIIRPSDGEVQLYCTTTRCLEIQDVSESGERQDLSFGERAVGLSFNPSMNASVDRIKSLYAQIIDEMAVLRNTRGGEMSRLASVAITEAQGAQMWAVKAITWRDE
jgi:hypothetical protein